MNVLPFIGVGLAAAIVAVLIGAGRRLDILVGLAGLVACLALVIAVAPGQRVDVGGSQLVLSGYGRLFLAVATGSGLLLCLVGLVTVPVSGDTERRDGPALPGRLAPATLLALAGLAIALASPDPLVAFPAALSAAAAGLLVSLPDPPTAAAIEAAGRHLRAVAVCTVLALAAVAWVGRPLGALSGPSAGLGIAYVAAAAAMALRSGAFPFHAWVARLTVSTPRLALPLLLAWLPAGLLLVGLDWERGMVVRLGPVLGPERALVIAVGATSLILGALGAWLQTDLEQVVAYSVVQEAGFGLLAVGTLELAAWEPARTWLLIFAVCKSAFAAWALVVESAFGTLRVDELHGWLRRSPLLGLGLAVIAVATIGVPGLPVFDARWMLVQLSLDDPIRTLVFVAGLAGVLPYLRLLVIGVAAPSRAVAAGAGWRPAWRGVERDALPAGSERAVGRTPNAALTGPGAGLSVRGTVRTLELVRTLAVAWRLNRAPMAAGLVLVLAVAGLALAAGAFGLPAAAGELPIPVAASSQAGLGVEGPGPTIPGSGSSAAPTALGPGLPTRSAAAPSLPASSP